MRYPEHMDEVRVAHGGPADTVRTYIPLQLAEELGANDEILDHDGPTTPGAVVNTIWVAGRCIMAGAFRAGLVAESEFLRLMRGDTPVYDNRYHVAAHVEELRARAGMHQITQIYGELEPDTQPDVAIRTGAGMIALADRLATIVTSVRSEVTMAASVGGGIHRDYQYERFVTTDAARWLRNEHDLPEVRVAGATFHSYDDKQGKGEKFSARVQTAAVRDGQVRYGQHSVSIYPWRDGVITRSQTNESLLYLRSGLLPTVGQMREEYPFDILAHMSAYMAAIKRP
jgi:hypothetical protein